MKNRLRVRIAVALFWLLSAFGALVANASLAVSDCLDPKGGHVQGMCRGDGCFFLTQKNGICKIDANGKCVAKEISHESAERAASQARIEAPVPNVMRTEANSSVVRTIELETEFVVCGGGLSGLCAAVAAARHGAKVVLVQDRPMLGGNASSEMRMGIMGAAGDENKETGILEELQLKNFYYNPLRRYTLWDDVMYSTVLEEKNITLLLNTSVDGVEMDGGRIAAVKAWDGNAYTRYVIRGKLFADCTGDGILRLSGAKYRHGRELPSEFGEDFQQGGGDGRTMGNSILLQLRETKEDHPFHAPAWAYKFTDADFVNDAQPKEKGRRYSYKRLYPNNNNFWWVEFGGNFDTIGDANAIQLELKKIAYGVWDYIKNHPDGRGKGYDLDWIGSLPGKRESVRFVGPKILTQHDVMSGGHFEDVVAYGGWTLDDHHPDAFWHHGYLSQHHRCPSPFGIPFDCLYSVNVPNLLFAGRDISVTHMALSATRVMATCAMLGQAVGTAASIAIREKCDPSGVRKEHLAELQTTLEDDDCMLPFRWRKVSALTAAAKTDPANEPLRNGIDRALKKSDNGVWTAPGTETMAYEWTAPQRISGARIVFDSVLKGMTKRMPKLEASQERVKMPAPLAKAFRIDVREKGAWRTVFADKLNILRLRKVTFAPVCADALRLVVTETWGGGEAHVFALDVLGETPSGIALVSPREGAVVPILSEAQKKFIRMPSADRNVLVENVKRRKSVLHAAGCRPQPVRFAWSCMKSGCDGLKYAVEVKRAADGKTIFAQTTRQTELTLDNFEVATGYRWTVSAVTRGGQRLVGVGAFQTEDHVPRLVRINGVPNVRDLGGRLGLDGRRVKQGLVFRSSGLNANACKCYSREEIMKMYEAGTLLSAVPERSRSEAQKVKDAIDSKRIGRATFNHLVKKWVPGKPRMKEQDVREALATFGIRTDIDLRTDRECYGMTESPLGPSVNWVHVSSRAYSELLTEEGRAAFARVFRVFLDEKNYPIDFHCIAGSDRTGTVAYVLGALLGYSEEDLLLDWELTAFSSSSSDFKRKTRYDKLVTAFAAFPGTCACERAECFVRSLGFSDADIARFRGIMFA